MKDGSIVGQLEGGRVIGKEIMFIAVLSLEDEVNTERIAKAMKRTYTTIESTHVCLCFHHGSTDSA